METYVAMRSGERWRLIGNRHNEDEGSTVIHIRAIIDGDYAVYRWWGKHKQRWHYQIESLYYLTLEYQAGRLEKMKLKYSEYS